MNLYRFGLETYIKDISGFGAKLYGGRWNSIGISMLYTSSNPSLAMLEFVCNTSGIAHTIKTCLLTLEIENNIKHETISINDLPENWQDVPAPNFLRQIGDNWVKDNKTLILKVPSAILSIENNFLVNTFHKDFSKIKVSNIIHLNIDNRILK